MEPGGIQVRPSSCLGDELVCAWCLRLKFDGKGKLKRMGKPFRASKKKAPLIIVLDILVLALENRKDG